VVNLSHAKNLKNKGGVDEEAKNGSGVSDDATPFDLD
jgi:hypothetical protein